MSVEMIVKGDRNDCPPGPYFTRPAATASPGRDAAPMKDHLVGGAGGVGGRGGVVGCGAAQSCETCRQLARRICRPELTKTAAVLAGTAPRRPVRLIDASWIEAPGGLASADVWRFGATSDMALRCRRGGASDQSARVELRSFNHCQERTR